MGESAMSEKIIVALDYPHVDKAKVLLEQLKGIPCYMKVGMELFYAAGPSFVEQLKKDGYRVFLDLKLHDIPNTVKGAARSIASLGVDILNVHAAGGVKMMEAAMEGVQEGANAAFPLPKVIAVTQLTSTTQQMMNDEIGIQGAVEENVLHYAKLAQEAGLHGVVASPLEVKKIKERCGEHFVTVTPGIRAHDAPLQDQSRTMTPAEAFQQGTDFIVMGRYITQAKDPRKTLEDIIEGLG
ncbi:orotidine-5'-phosphate decarboxylase [Longirhabdus pacifica]|uniref:orotidine-5'-phosphate decarboxylase n=1 Tax=Longirhabdus pacifica TaxID=2305227 RepID=UPI0023EA7589|nr:orotidine-5'-phosphate decarboxylase [Longirhabdus pacifica]